jgi:hypothetical protein
MTPSRKRALSIVGIFVAGGFFVWIGLDGWTISTMPAHYLGFIVLAVGVAGMCGLNIWHGGPLDPKNDSQSIRPEDKGR